jgi:hypothetical protein
MAGIASPREKVRHPIAVQGIAPSVRETWLRRIRVARWKCVGRWLRIGRGLCVRRRIRFETRLTIGQRVKIWVGRTAHGCFSLGESSTAFNSSIRA